MSVKIPPSPSAEEAPDYARRLREVRDLTQSKKPTRRRRKTLSSSVGTSRNGEREKRANVGNVVPLDSMRKPLATETAAFDQRRKRKQPEKVASQDMADRGSHKKAQSAQPLGDTAKDKVRFPRASSAQVSKPNSSGVPSLSRVALASAAISAVVAVIVTFASQGIAAQAATNGAVIVAGLLNGLGA